MENFIVSARKYRPSDFESVVGQRSITTTLKNSIKNNHLAHAYLFCGPRGVGKTTCARIFAKTINCYHITESIEACNQCESCKSFQDGRSYNIHELDAASNNSVEDIRNLIDQVRVPPQIGKYKIYIIDEVHMLSAAAFNAFLKTLEEPPSHTIFILATTEKHKIIPTILSRCQIFDFNRIKISDTVDYLGYIAKKEEVEFEPEGLNIIAQKADGAMRDALSIFDQLVSFSGGELTYEKVITNLNVLDYDYYFRLTDGFFSGDTPGVLLIFNEILNKGFDPHNFLNGLSRHFRDLLVCKDEATIQLLEVGTTIREQYLQQAKKCTESFLFQSLEITNKFDVSFRFSKDPRLHVELALVQLTQVEKKKIDATLDQPEHKEPLIHKPVRKEENVAMPVTTQEKKEPRTTTSSSKLKTTSISAALKGEAKPIEEKDIKADIVEEPIQEEEITRENLEKSWLLFMEGLDEYPRMQTTLRTIKPLLEKEGKIHAAFSNTAQKEDFETNFYHKLKAFLIKELKNSRIEIVTSVSEREEEKKSLYTDEDKFLHLSKKNPNLGKLKQQFNLDFE